MSATLAYTDGACIGNPGPGGWAVAMNGKTYAGGWEYTTNNVMELYAVFIAVTFCTTPILAIVTDSVLVHRLISGKATARKEHIFKILELIFTVVKWKGMTVQSMWTKGHAKNEMNNLVDGLAREQAEIQKWRQR